MSLLELQLFNRPCKKEYKEARTLLSTWNFSRGSVKTRGHGLNVQNRNDNIRNATIHYYLCLKINCLEAPSVLSTTINRRYESHMHT